jgi:hypothetical protein
VCGTARASQTLPTDQSFVGPNGERGFGEFRIGNDPDRVLMALGQSRRTQQLEPLIDPDEELRRSDEKLDRAELRALNHAGGSSQAGLLDKIRP